jgi:hypothetical protein
MKKYILSFLFLFHYLSGLSQVKDISFTGSPFVDYTFFDKKSGLENALSIGGKLGFGFGEYIEIRAVYLQSLGLETKFSNFGIEGYDDNLFNPQEINLTRWGGEIKANLGRGKFIPYLTLGSGVQNIEIKGGNDFDQIYSSLGLGFKTKLNDRLVFTVEGKYNRFNLNAGKDLLTEEDKTDFGVTNDDFSTKLLTNWSAQASLQFYLGGRKPGTLNDLDRAYFEKFRKGFKGIQWVFEPSINYIDFDKSSLFRDTYLVGLYAGFDFNQYTGIRGFFFRATENKELSTSFDYLSMYGMEFRARLNDGNGVTPYLILGGGYLNTLDNYKGTNGFPFDSEEFASAGLGLNIPLTKNILITGGVRGLITSASNVEDLTTPEQLQTHIMYNAGLKLTFGKKSTDPYDVYQSQLDEALSEKDKETQDLLKQKLTLQNAENNEKLKALRKEYQEKIASLQDELEDAKTNNDINKAVEVLEQKKVAEKALDDVTTIERKSKSNTIQLPQKQEEKTIIIAEEKAEKVVQPKKTVDTEKTNQAVENKKPQTDAETKTEIAPKKAAAIETPKTVEQKEFIKLTPQEFERLIDQVMEYERSYNVQPTNNKAEINLLKKRIETLEKALLEKNRAKTPVNTEVKTAPKTETKK